ncbi:ER membrane protein complex subunit 10-like isoform X1 [Camellia sinensis]|uniref:ER membrane protein complex subunit 10-like isoform X1 n=1 Tax=Camellia sinensis TaxID=4442 RepID=UPI0010366012|nr:ER membrane protein complex subunit 10-like isoform X1 [Camellia sinensis]
MTRIKNGHYWFLITTIVVISMCLSSSSLAFQSDELLLDDEEFGLEGARSPPDLQLTTPTRSIPPPPATVTPSQPTSPARTKSSDPDSKVQFPLEHAFGDSDFSPAGTFTARLKTWSHGGQTLTKLRFSREAFTEIEKEKFKKLLEGDNFYRIRVPSNVLSPPGRDYIISSVKARCLPQDRLDEHFVIHMDGVNILAVNYGSPGACPYPRQLKLPAKWSFNSHTVLKNSEQAPRIVTFVDEILGGETGEGEVVKPPERSFWAKYWMYLIPLGIIVMNAITQAMNMPEEQATSGQSASQIPQQTTAAIRGGPTVAVRRR